MPLGIVNRRPTPPPPYETRDKYLNAKNPANPRICSVASGDTQPWLTPVLGSGCATSKSQVEALLGTVVALEKCATDLYEGIDIAGRPIGEVVSLFAMDLIEDRLRMSRLAAVGPNGARPQPRDRVPVPMRDQWVGAVFVAAATLAKLYHEVKALSCDAPRRPGHGDAALLSRASQHWQNLNERYTALCVQALDHVRATAHDVAPALVPGDQAHAMAETVIALVSRLRKNVDVARSGKIRVPFTDLQSLAEFAWFCLTCITEPKVYPGWSDLLLDLSNYDSPLAGGVGTPLFDTMTEAQAFIRARYREITEQRFTEVIGPWGQPEPGTGGLHAAVAALLDAEQRRRLIPAPVSRPPIVTAFVTSFDMELELALVSLGVAFTVALPVHVLNRKHDIAHTCWLTFRVRKDARLTDLLRPTEEDWFVLDEKCAVAGPIVVRLAGCPVVELPDLRVAAGVRARVAELFYEALKEDAGGRSDVLQDVIESLVLQSAVVINEHDAILQNAIDLIAISSGSGTVDTQGAADFRGTADSNGIRYGLPTGLVAGNQKWSRFWMMFGVQLGDSAFRHRIATLISSVPLRNPMQPRPSEPSAHRNGLAVNIHATDVEQDLLFWNGFDVVNADVTEFAVDLAHYARHLEKNVQLARGGQCHV
jgi:hypothetical protein